MPEHDENIKVEMESIKGEMLVKIEELRGEIMPELSALKEIAKSLKAEFRQSTELFLKLLDKQENIISNQVTRLIQQEKNTISHGEKIKNLEKDIGEIKENHKWALRTAIVAIITAIGSMLTILLKAFKLI